MSSGQKLHSFLKKTLKAFTPDEPEISGGDPTPNPASSSSRATSSQPEDLRRSAALAELFNVDPEAVTIQQQTRKNGTSCTFFQVYLETEAGALNLAISADFLQAFLLDMDSRSEVNAEILHSLLVSRGLQCDPARVQQALDPESASCRKRKIAQGKAPQNGCDEQVAYPAFADPTVHSTVAPFSAFLATGQLVEATTQTRAVWVTPGQVVAELQPPSPGIEGHDIFGRPLPAFDGNATGLTAGPGVDLDDEGGLFKAMAPGYLYLHQRVLGICTPLTLAQDGSSAIFTYIPGWASSPPTAEELQGYLDEYGVKQGIDTAACRRAADAFRQDHTEPCGFPLAQGVPAQHGQHGEIYFDVDCNPKPGRVNPEDGSIDFRETCFGLDVPAGIRLARLSPATPGQPGYTIFGEVLLPTPGDPKQLTAGAHVDVFEEGQELIFKAAIDGRVSFKQGVLQVHETLLIPADVDYRTGNVEFSGDVFISGSVLSGFSVKARGSIAVQGQVEAGACLQAKGDITVSGGIFGTDSHISADGSVAAKFIQDASVRTGSDLTVGSYIFNADVRSVGKVVVNQGTGRRSGIISGGEVVAAQGIQARFAGSPNGTPTQLVVGVDPAVEESLSRCQQKLARCEKKRDHLRHLLGLDEVTLDHLKRLLAHTPPRKREQVAEFIRQWQKFDKATRAMRSRCVDLLNELTTSAPEALLAIDQVIYPGVSLQLGEHKAQVQLELKDTQLTSDTWTENLHLQPAA